MGKLEVSETSAPLSCTAFNPYSCSNPSEPAQHSSASKTAHILFSITSIPRLALQHPHPILDHLDGPATLGLRRLLQIENLLELLEHEGFERALLPSLVVVHDYVFQTTGRGPLLGLGHD